MHHVPLYLSWSFIGTTLLAMLAAILLYHNTPTRSIHRKTYRATFILVVWLSLQGLLAWSGFYAPDPEMLPPRIMVFGIIPVWILIAVLFMNKRGRNWVDNLPLKQLHYVHLIRIPVELVLWGLFQYNVIPEEMTFEGRNWDIIAGLTAPTIIAYGFMKNGIHRRALILWNVISLALLLNIIIHAALTTPSPFQQWAFDQPNIAILFFPFHWLPTFIAQLVLFCHIAALRQLMRRSAHSSPEVAF